jgi:hypothetical protein
MKGREPMAFIRENLRLLVLLACAGGGPGQIAAQDTPAPLVEPEFIDLKSANDRERNGLSADPNWKPQPDVLTTGQNASREGRSPEDPGASAGAGPAWLPLADGNALSTFVSDRGAAAFDRTSFRFGDFGSGFGPLLAGSGPARSGPFAFKGSLGLSEVAENESGDSAGGQQGWEFGTRISGSAEATIGFPQTGRYLEVQYAA